MKGFNKGKMKGKASMREHFEGLMQNCRQDEGQYAGQDGTQAEGQDGRAVNGNGGRGRGRRKGRRGDRGSKARVMACAYEILRTMMTCVAVRVH